MKLSARMGRDGVMTLCPPLSRTPVFTVTEEKGGAVCHVRAKDGSYLASLERDTAIRGSLIFNVYKGSVRVGTVAAAERVSKDPDALPVLSFSWGKREFDGRRLTAPIWESDARRRRELAEIRKTLRGFVLRLTNGISQGDACDAVLALSAVMIWDRVRKRQGGGSL